MLQFEFLIYRTGLAIFVAVSVVLLPRIKNKYYFLRLILFFANTDV
jgi:hypothetical protein